MRKPNPFPTAQDSKSMISRLIGVLRLILPGSAFEKQSTLDSLHVIPYTGCSSREF